jgi:ribonuclease E
VAAPSAAEPELRQAVADLDAAPPAAPVSTEMPPPAAPPASAEPEPPRRRSTVRERAPIAGGADTAQPPVPPDPAPAAEPAPQPVVSGPGETENADRPRRTGWWSRRLAGG